uniref:RNA-directed RNA polymerase catalytic subunit n=1 Tax=Beihai orthomyxo-like virus 2 TaxID=1922495 RepID=A0A1L3KKG0_9VIRU|nr:polymerase PB1 [Beihai orthomyxo-like virus 2]
MPKQHNRDEPFREDIDILDENQAIPGMWFSIFKDYTGKPPTFFGKATGRVIEAIFGMSKYSQIPIEKFGPAGGVNSALLKSCAGKCFMDMKQQIPDLEADWLKKINCRSTILQQGRSTFCPFEGKNVPAGTAYLRMKTRLSINGIVPTDGSLFALGEAVIRLCDPEKFPKVKCQMILPEKISRTGTVEKTKVYTQMIPSEEFKIMLAGQTAAGKDKERGKTERRAIWVTTMENKLFTRIAEELFIILIEAIGHQCITIGDKDADAAIIHHCTPPTLPDATQNMYQGTLDMTKWNQIMTVKTIQLMISLICRIWNFSDSSTILANTIMFLQANKWVWLDTIKLHADNLDVKEVGLFSCRWEELSDWMQKVFACRENWESGKAVSDAMRETFGKYIPGGTEKCREFAAIPLGMGMGLHGTGSSLVHAVCMYTMSTMAQRIHNASLFNGIQSSDDSAIYGTEELTDMSAAMSKVFHMCLSAGKSIYIKKRKWDGKIRNEMTSRIFHECKINPVGQPTNGVKMVDGSPTASFNSAMAQAMFMTEHSGPLSGIASMLYITEEKNDIFHLGDNPAEDETSRYEMLQTYGLAECHPCTARKMKGNVFALKQNAMWMHAACNDAEENKALEKTLHQKTEIPVQPGHAVHIDFDEVGGIYSIVPHGSTKMVEGNNNAINNQRMMKAIADILRRHDPGIDLDDSQTSSSVKILVDAAQSAFDDERLGTKLKQAYLDCEKSASTIVEEASAPEYKPVATRAELKRKAFATFQRRQSKRARKSL